MRISRKGVLRVIGLLTLAVLVQAQAPGLLVEASRDQADCVQACNNVRDLCRVECGVDCSALFPPGTARDTCIESCRKVCLDEMQECKAKCNIRKFPPTPTEP